MISPAELRGLPAAGRTCSRRRSCADDADVQKAFISQFVPARHGRAWLIPALLAFGLCSNAGLCADASTLRIVDAEVGFDGQMKVGCWTPVRVTIDGPPGQTVEPRLIAPDPDGSPTTWPLPTVTLDGNGPRDVSGVFRLGRIQGHVRIEAGTESVTISPPRDTSGEREYDQQSVVYIGLLGPAAGFEQEFERESTEAAGDTTAPAGGASRAVRLLKFETPEELPEAVDALDALDVLVISQAAPLDDLRSQVVSEWVQAGGHLVLMLEQPGNNGAVRLPVPWVPIETRGRGQFNDLGVLTSRLRETEKLLAGRGIQGVRIRINSGRTLISSLDGPLVVRVAYGLGRVTVFVLDWTRPPLRDWKGLPEFCRILADIEAPGTRQETHSASTQLRPTGVSDLTTQLAAHLDNFRDVERPSYWTVLGFIVVFLLVAGPLDYLLVRYWLKRPHVTWFTFPVWVVLASLGGTLYATNHNGARLQSNQFDLIDIDVATGLMRARSWMTLYSPEPRRYRVEPEMASWLTATAGPTAGAPRLTWSGSPEIGFRGMYRKEGLELATPAYELQTQRAGVDNLPIDQWSSKALAAWWQQQSAASVAALVDNDLQADASNLLSGSVTHHLPVPISDWCLAYQTHAYIPHVSRSTLAVPELPPGRPWVRDQVVQPRVLAGFLKGQTYHASQNTDPLKRQGIEVRTEYDPFADDPELLARTVTFYDAAGGPEYTALQNDPLARWDLSRLLELNRAVLFGRIELPAVTYRVDGQEIIPARRTTFVRIVLPVKPPARQGF